MDAISLLAEACSGSTAVVAEAVVHNEQFVDVAEEDDDLSPLDSKDINLSEDMSFQFKTSSRGNWTAEEDELLRNAVQQFGGRNWKKISDLIVDRTDVQCLHRWQKVLRPGLIKGPWTAEVSACL